MNIFEIIILGIIQGLTEFIPVSSSGHLVVAEHFMIGSVNHLFIEFINIGTLLALLIFFRKKIINIFKDAVKQKSYKLLINLLFTSIPAGLAGFILADYIDSSSFFSSAFIVALALLFAGVIMIVSDRLPSLGKLKSYNELSPKRALSIGIVQVFALVPGVSRSGSTIIAGKVVGLSNRDAAEYSFLASIPIMLGVCAKLILKDHIYLTDNLPVVLLSNLVAFAAGMFAIRFMLNYLSTRSLAVFGWYRVVLASIILLALLIFG